MRFGFSHCPDDGFAEIVRMRTREAQPSHAGNAADSAQKIREVMLPVEIRVHRLPEKDNLGNP